MTDRRIGDDGTDAMGESFKRGKTESFGVGDVDEESCVRIEFL